jgi:hypothetical protein
LTIRFILLLGTALLPAALLAQQGSASGNGTGQQRKHILGIIPNNRVAPSLTPYHPISPAQKFRIAFEDTFDRGNFALTGLIAAESQWTDANPSFGQGAKGYARYYAATFADLGIGNYLTEALFPAMLHQDPRYFRRGSGTGWSRLAYTAGQILFTHSDAGRTQLNYSELLGNSAAVALSNAYYPDKRNARDAAVKLGTQLGIDMLGNVLREFWPDVARKLSRQNPNPSP